MTPSKTSCMPEAVQRVHHRQRHPSPLPPSNKARDLFPHHLPLHRLLTNTALALQRLNRIQPSISSASLFNSEHMHLSQAEVGPAVLPAVARIVAIGDLHGDMDKTRRAFRLGGLIDANDRWIGGTTTAVQACLSQRPHLQCPSCAEPNGSPDMWPELWESSEFDQRGDEHVYCQKPA